MWPHGPYVVFQGVFYGTLGHIHNNGTVFRKILVSNHFALTTTENNKRVAMYEGVYTAEKKTSSKRFYEATVR